MIKTEIEESWFLLPNDEKERYIKKNEDFIKKNPNQCKLLTPKMLGELKITLFA